MKFGILGEAKIAREWLVPAILDAGHEVTHIGRRSPGKETLHSVYKGAIETDYESLLLEPSSMTAHGILLCYEKRHSIHNCR